MDTEKLKEALQMEEREAIVDYSKAPQYTTQYINTYLIVMTPTEFNIFLGTASYSPINQQNQKITYHFGMTISAETAGLLLKDLQDQLSGQHELFNSTLRNQPNSLRTTEPKSRA